MTGSASLAERLSTGDSAYLSVTNVTDGRSHPRVEGTFTTNGPSRANGTLGRIVPGSGYVTIGTERWYIEVKERTSGGQNGSS